MANKKRITPLVKPFLLNSSGVRVFLVMRDFLGVKVSPSAKNNQKIPINTNAITIQKIPTSPPIIQVSPFVLGKRNLSFKLVRGLTQTVSSEPMVRHF